MAAKAYQVGRAISRDWTDPGEVTDRLVGIELEYEDVTGVTLGEPHQSKSKNYVATKWQGVKDGSLRKNGAEFVSDPIPFSTLASELRDLFSSIKTSSKWIVSSRTGLHVHVDVRDFTIDQLKSLNTTHCLIEPALFEYVGVKREESVFCVPSYKANNDVLQLTNYLEDKNPSNALIGIREPTFSKYSALNWCPITKYGTVEFRHAENYADIAAIVRWAEICVSVVNFAKNMTQQEIMDAYMEDIDAFPHAHIHSSLRTRGYEMTMLKCGAEVLANRTVTSPANDPMNPKNWIRVNDKLPYVKPPREIDKYMIRKNKPIPSSNWITQLQQAPPQLPDFEEFNTEEPG